MPFCIYILQRKSYDRYYCGQTNSLELLIKEHNKSNYHSITKHFKGHWQPVKKLWAH
ncbi:MAG: GIY-YIG nuclease family protein [Deltaproteobacteria bacterium]|nr:GIY-YIG nuclease family protein [Deltaproteobacteria bacterium]MBW2180801.1 GIY-YIG nuclease family protein [Deltaproteobacteria bacterium]